MPGGGMRLRLGGSGETVPAYRPWEICLLYTSDAADEGLGVDLGGRRIIKKKIYNATSGSVN